MKILVADDDLLYRKLLEASLRSWGYEVHLVSDGAAAWDAIETAKSGLLAILDWSMPGLDGLKLIEEVRKEKWPVSLIVMTGYGSIDEAVKAMRMGALDFLTKPVEWDHLKLVLDRAIRERGLMAEVAILRERLREIYLADAAGYTIYRDSTRKEKLELRREPVYVWTNPIATSGQDGHVFVWTCRGRAEVVGTFFSYPSTGPRNLNHELHSLSASVLDVARPGGAHTWTPAAPGIEPKPIVGASVVARKPSPASKPITISFPSISP